MQQLVVSFRFSEVLALELESEDKKEPATPGFGRTFPAEERVETAGNGAVVRDEQRARWSPWSW